MAVCTPVTLMVPVESTGVVDGIDHADLEHASIVDKMSMRPQLAATSATNPVT